MGTRCVLHLIHRYARTPKTRQARFGEPRRGPPSPPGEGFYETTPIESVSPEIPRRHTPRAFPPRHPERSRNPSATRIKRCEALLGISAEKFDSAQRVCFQTRHRAKRSRMTRAGADADAKCKEQNAKLNKNVVPYLTHSFGALHKGQPSFVQKLLNFVCKCVVLIITRCFLWDNAVIIFGV